MVLIPVVVEARSDGAARGAGAWRCGGGGGARAAEATSRLWEARCVAELSRAEAGVREAQLRVEQRALEELSSAEGDAGSRSESEDEEQYGGNDSSGGAVVPQAVGPANGTGTCELRLLDADGVADASTVDEAPAPAPASVIGVKSSKWSGAKRKGMKRAKAREAAGETAAAPAAAEVGRQQQEQQLQ